MSTIPIKASLLLITTIGLLIYGQLDKDNPKLDVFHVKFKDIQAMELSAHKEGGELILYIADQDTTLQYRIFDDESYTELQNKLIKLWERPTRW